MRHYDYDDLDEDRYYDDADCGGYTREELDDMYRAAFEGDPEAEWNID